MENNLPLPMPDRRAFNSENNSMLNTEISNQNYLFSEESNKKNQRKGDLKESMSTAQIMQIEDMRQKILSYKLLSEKTIYMNSLQNDPKLKKCNLILFGPSGVGKTSFIKSIYKALFYTDKIPNENISKLIARNKNYEEKKVVFNQYQIIKQSNNNNGLIICDTRDNIKIYQNSFTNNSINNSPGNSSKYSTISMNPQALLDFWEKSFDYFPKEIFKEEIGFGNVRSIPHVVIFVFDGTKEKILNNENLPFYQNLINISKNKGYKDVHIVLTGLDEFEKKILEKNITEGEIHSEINKLKNIKIENVISLFGVNWSNVHFIENYHWDEQIENIPSIDYNILKTLLDIINSAELFILDKIVKVPSCYGFCSIK